MQSTVPLAVVLAMVGLGLLARMFTPLLLAPGFAPSA